VEEEEESTQLVEEEEKSTKSVKEEEKSTESVEEEEDSAEQLHEGEYSAKQMQSRLGMRIAAAWRKKTAVWWKKGKGKKVNGANTNASILRF
jgi:hypothetical protein